MAPTHTKRPRLYAESFAPWCEKARWALDHHGVLYDYTETVPVLAEVTLRVATRALRGTMTVPLLVAESDRWMGSLDVARFAERAGSGDALFPAAHEVEVLAWNDESERLMLAGRALLLPRMGASAEALEEQLPPFVPEALRPRLRWIASAGVRHLTRKYATEALSAEAHEAACRQACERLRTALRERGRHLVGTTLTYADIAMAAALQFLLPVEQRFIALGPATREAWTHRAIAAEYGELFEWRDALYRAHRDVAT